MEGHLLEWELFFHCKRQLCAWLRMKSKYLETPEPGSFRVPSLLKASSFSCGLSRSIRVGLRGRGE